MAGFGINDGRGFPHINFSELFTQRQADRDALNATAKEKQLHGQLDRLELICKALWSLLKEQTNLTEEDIARRVQEIDLADGVQDGKITKQLSVCPQCQRPLSQRHHRCLYCGYTPPDGDFTAFQQPVQESGR